MKETKTSLKFPVGLKEEPYEGVSECVSGAVGPIMYRRHKL